MTQKRGAICQGGIWFTMLETNDNICGYLDMFRSKFKSIINEIDENAFITIR